MSDQIRPTPETEQILTELALGNIGLAAANEKIGRIERERDEARHWNAVIQKNTGELIASTSKESKQLIEQRDKLAETLNYLIRGASNLAGALDCCEDGPTASDVLRWDVIGEAKEVLASLKGGSDE